MADQLTSYFTLAGYDLATKTLAGKNQIKFTRGIASSVDWHSKTEEDIKQLTTLPDQQQETSISKVEIQKDKSGNLSPDAITVGLLFSQAGVKKDYQMQTVGLFAAPVVEGKVGAEILYTITTFSTPQWMQYDKNGSTVALDLTTVIGDTAQLNVILNQNEAEGGLNQAALDSLEIKVTNKMKTGYVAKNLYPTGDATNDAKDEVIVTNASMKKYLKDHPVQGPAGKDGAQGKDGKQGKDGVSAYQEWLNAGNSGTAQDFLKSLKGDAGAAGGNGKSAYQIWLDQGGKGDEKTFLATLKGEMGEKGAIVTVNDASGKAAAKSGSTVTLPDFLLKTGNAASATKLATPRKINGKPFDGTSDITVTDDTKQPKGDYPTNQQMTDAIAKGGKVKKVDGKDPDAAGNVTLGAITAAQLQAILGFKQAVYMTAADYAKLATKDPQTLYFTSEG